MILVASLPDFGGEVVRPPLLVDAVRGDSYAIIPSEVLPLDRLEEVNAVEETVALSVGVPIIRSAEVLCTPECAQVDRSGVLLFRDTDHLASAGARLLARDIVSVLLGD